ncbi:hypothetical protein NQ318_018747 [Aromia moschata]|uniref:Uncharacterized protein n=1 Tax=Aromia moschata TaxID=1265417 RepID=A0AAV8ZH68_9CUCU|nr:hypothetical protein NQ318_018747 [Aromia moschata]
MVKPIRRKNTPGTGTEPVFVPVLTKSSHYRLEKERFWNRFQNSLNSGTASKANGSCTLKNGSGTEPVPISEAVLYWWNRTGTEPIYEVWLLNNSSSTSKTDENIEKIGKLIREGRRLSIRGLAEITGIDKECVRQILHESFNMRKVCAKIVPKLLTPEQKESKMNICADILNNIDTDPGLLDTVIT